MSPRCAWCGNSEWVSVKQWYMGLRWTLWCGYCCEMTVPAPDSLTGPPRLRQIAAELLDGADEMEAHAGDPTFDHEALQERLCALAEEATQIMQDLKDG